LIPAERLDEIINRLAHEDWSPPDRARAIRWA
jgi:hypothetical protein